MQEGQTNGFSPLCLLSWSFRWDLCLNACRQRGSTAERQTDMWEADRWDRCELTLSHIWQAKGLSLLWTLSCFLRSGALMNDFPQTSHRYGLNPVWIFRCSGTQRWDRWGRSFFGSTLEIHHLISSTHNSLKTSFTQWPHQCNHGNQVIPYLSHIWNRTLSVTACDDVTVRWSYLSSGVSVPFRWACVVKALVQISHANGRSAEWSFSCFLQTHTHTHTHTHFTGWSYLKDQSIKVCEVLLR